jgi:hypothetical protein
MEYYGPYTARFAWAVYRAIDWTHIHHEQTYDVIIRRPFRCSSRTVHQDPWPVL